MQHFFDWSRGHINPARPWLVLGKGPSFAQRTRFDLSGYELLSLNHAVREQPVRLAHMIDLDVVNACGAALLSNAEYVVLPWYPHVRNAPGTRSLEELARDHELLSRLARENRLIWYDLSLAPRRHGPGPVVQATYFSAEAAVNMLALAGVRRVRSLGVDGGASYSAQFEDLAQRTLLANGQPAFDLQFAGIARTILQTGVDFAPLDQPSPIVACVLSPESTPLVEQVLEFSIRKHTSMSVAVHWARSVGDLARLPPRLPESDSAVAKEVQRAILLHAESLVLDDLRKLWSHPMEQGVAVPRDSAVDADGTPALVLIAGNRTQMDAAMAAASHTLDPGRAGAVAAGWPSIVRDVPPSWNCRDRVERGGASLLWFRAPRSRPWISRDHPLAHLWVTTLIEAVQASVVSVDLVRTEVRLGRVRPSLLEQVERGNPESLLVSRAARRLDAAFASEGVRSGPPALRLRLLLRASARQARRRVRAYYRRLANSR